MKETDNGEVEQRNDLQAYGRRTPYRRTGGGVLGSGAFGLRGEGLSVGIKGLPSADTGRGEVEAGYHRAARASVGGAGTAQGRRGDREHEGRGGAGPKRRRIAIGRALQARTHTGGGGGALHEGACGRAAASRRRPERTAMPSMLRFFCRHSAPCLWEGSVATRWHLCTTGSTRRLPWQTVWWRRSPGSSTWRRPGAWRRRQTSHPTARQP